MNAFIDTNILIYAMERHPEFGEKAGKVIEMVDNGEVSGLVSSLVLLDICWYLESKEQVDVMKRVIDVLDESRLRVVEVTGADVAEAVELRPVYKNVDLNDLVNYCIMVRLGVRNVYTNDSHFNQLPDNSPHFS